MYPELSLNLMIWRPGGTYPEFASKHDDLPAALLLSEAPLHQVLAGVPGEAHVAACHGGVGGARQDVGLGLVVGVHPIGVGDPQGVVKAYLVAAPTLVWRSSRTDAIRYNPAEPVDQN